MEHARQVLLHEASPPALLFNILQNAQCPRHMSTGHLGLTAAPTKPMALPAEMASPPGEEITFILARILLWVFVLNTGISQS
jgi:hypothetical protein